MKKSIVKFPGGCVIAFLQMLFAIWNLNLAYSQKITTFQKSFGGKSDDQGCSVILLPDNGYLIAGTTASYGSGGTDILLIRTDSLGHKLWAKTYGGSGDEGIPYYLWVADVDLILLPDSNVMVCTSTQSYGAGGSDVYLIKMDLNGNLKWAKTYGGISNDYGYYIINDPNGGFLITGETFSYGVGSGNILVIKTDTSGGVIWAKAYGNASHEQAGYQASATVDGNFLIPGYSHDPSNSSHYMEMFIKIDDNGKLLFNKVYSGSNNTDAESIMDIPDSSIYISGFTYNPIAPSNAVAMFSKYDKNGNLKWAKIYDKNSHNGLGRMVYDKSTKYFNCDYGTSNGDRSGVLRLDTSGKFIALKCFGPITSGVGYYSWNQGRDILELPSGGFVKALSTKAFGFGGTDFYLVKVDKNLTNPDSCNILSSSFSPTNFTSYVNNSTPTYTTTSFSPSVGSGVEVTSPSPKDTLVCAPFATNFNWQAPCLGQTTLFQDSSYAKPTSWKWNFDDASSSSNTSTTQNPTHIYSKPGKYTIKLVSTNGTDIDSITHVITIYPIPGHIKTTTYSFCLGDSLNFNVSGTGGNTFSWSPGSLLNDSTDSTVWVKPRQSTTFVAMVANASGCSVTDTFIANIGHLPALSLANQTSCDSIIVLSPGPYSNVTYLWSNGDTGNAISVDVSGKYWVKVEKNGCSASDTAVITLLPRAVFADDIPINIEFCGLDSNFALNAGPAFKYLWSPGGDTTKTINIFNSGAYTIQITAADGCTASKTIVVKDVCSPELYVPDVFTPDGNGLNVIFKAVSFWPLESFNMQIYNRWGERLFQSNDINTGWNGTFTNGWDGIYKEPRCPLGVYLYIILYKFPNEIEQMKSGTVTLLR